MRSRPHALPRQTLASLGLIGALVASTAAASATQASATQTSTSASASTAIPANVRWQQTRTSLLGKHIWYRQVYQNLPVLGGYYAQHITTTGKVEVADGRLLLTPPASLKAQISATQAQSLAVASLRAATAKISTPASKSKAPAATLPLDNTESAQLAIRGGATTRLVWRVIHSGSTGVVESQVDAITGTIISVRNLAKNATGSGRVFNPNPSVSLKNQSFTDVNDTNQPRLRGAYRIVPLTHLKYSNTLTGDYARVLNRDGAASTSGSFLYFRASGKFEHVMAYRNVTTSQEYLQSLGFTDVNNESQKLSINTTAEDNSFYHPEIDVIQFGRGGVDDAEDSEIIWHEYGHAIQDDQVPGFGSSSEAGAIGEGFGDYWAMTNSVPVSAGYGLPCIGEWDATSYTTGSTHCLRRLDGTKTTDDIRFEVHDDGEIWSRALYDIYQGLGRKKSDTLMIEAQFNFTPDTSFAAAAGKVIATANTLYGADAARICQQSFQARKIVK
jgi:Zn-dependent metalloprotease